MMFRAARVAFTFVMMNIAAVAGLFSIGFSILIGRGAAAAAAGFRDAMKSCQNTRIGLATKIEEYVPTRIPTTNANENPSNTSPPNNHRAIAVKKVRPEVRMVRLSV